jgi:hypothetical protein
LNGLIFGVHYLFPQELRPYILGIVAMAYGVCDIICILFFCPFQTWFMKNRCCTTCRIYNWDFAMLFTPFLFIPSLYTYSLLGMALLILARWEITYKLHPERFSERTNEALRCKNCTEKLCKHKVQLQHYIKEHKDILFEKLEPVVEKLEPAIKAIDNQAENIEETVAPIEEGIQETYQRAKEFTTDAYGKVKDVTTEAYGKVKDVTTEACEKVLDKTAETISAVVDRTVDTYEWAKDFTAETYGKVKDVTTEVYGKVKDTAKELLGMDKQRSASEGTEPDKELCDNPDAMEASKVEAILTEAEEPSQDTSDSIPEKEDATI